MAQYQLVGTATNADEIAQIINTRRQQLGLTMAEMNNITGFADRYVSKIFAPNYPKSLGKLSLPIFLETLGLRLCVVADDESLPKITRRAISERSMSAARAGFVEQRSNKEIRI